MRKAQSVPFLQFSPASQTSIGTLGVALSSMVPGLWPWTVRTDNVRSNFKYMLRRKIEFPLNIFGPLFFKNWEIRCFCSTNIHPISLTWCDTTIQEKNINGFSQYTFQEVCWFVLKDRCVVVKMLHCRVWESNVYIFALYNSQVNTQSLLLSLHKRFCQERISWRVILTHYY